MHLHMCPQTKHRLRFASRESHAPGRAMTTRVHRLEKVVVVATMVRESQRQLRAAGFYHSKCDRKHVTLHGLQLTTPLTGHAGGDCIQGYSSSKKKKTKYPNRRGAHSVALAPNLLYHVRLGCPEFGANNSWPQFTRS
uniref:UBP-type domain-containing protein n=1 Tax=Mesocestoides corti TaxID=53468 RepID=A0A5K3FUB9_MESCO